MCLAFDKQSEPGVASPKVVNGCFETTRCVVTQDGALVLFINGVIWF